MFCPRRYAAREFCAAEHGGTHLDAPYHFYEGGWRVGDIPLERLIAPGILVDISDELTSNASNNNGTNINGTHINGTNNNRTYNNGKSTNLRASHLDKWVETNGEIPPGSVLLVKFGWSRFYNNATKYLGSRTGTGLNFPGISEEAARWIVDTGRIVGVGVDTASVDPGDSVAFDAHRILSARQIYGLENVNLNEQLPARDFVLFVMPMNLKEGSGAPLRLLVEIRPNLTIFN